MKYLYTKEGQLFGELKYCSNIFTNYKKHSHCMLSFSVIENGELSVKYDTDAMTLHTESIAVFNPHQIHCTNNINASGYYVLYLDINWCQNIQKELFQNYKTFIHINENIIINQTIYNNLIKACKTILTKDHNEYEEALITIVKNIFVKYCNSKRVKTGQYNQNIIYKMKKYINDNLDKPISIDDISNNLAYNKSYLIRLFKKETGITPQDFIINQKINRAKELIRKSNTTTLSDLAQTVGFYDQSHFNRNFKRIFALSPKYYQTT